MTVIWYSGDYRLKKIKHTHTHTHIYIYIYVHASTLSEWCRSAARSERSSTRGIKLRNSSIQRALSDTTVGRVLVTFAVTFILTHYFHYV